MREKFEALIRNTIEQYCREKRVPMIWEAPILRFASAHDEKFAQLKQIVVEDHYLPTDYLKNAASVFSYFIPFKREISKSNKEGTFASKTWANSYLITNNMFETINETLVGAIKAMGYDACPPRDAGMISMENPRSRWSQKHVAYIAGHGTFGLNNMLITDRGTVGRFASVISALPVKPDPIPTEERCLYKREGTCGLCAKRCVNNALTIDHYDRMKCLAQCMKNDAKYPGADVCGKCVVELPCSYGRK